MIGEDMDKQEEIVSLFRAMMADFEGISRDDEIYRRDAEEIGELKIQWDICGVSGYQILRSDDYAYELGEVLGDPDITFIWEDPDEAIRFLEGESFSEFAHVPHRDYRGEFIFRYTAGWDTVDEGSGPEKERIRKDVMRAEFDPKKGYHPLLLERLPMFRRLRNAPDVPREGDDGEYGTYIPINQSLVVSEGEILPIKVFKHFFDKASNIFLLNKCPCREFRDCQDHDHTIGCMHLGDDSLKILAAPERGRIIGREEALAILQRATDDGLIPILGRSKGEARGMGVGDTGHFMSMCFCCTCCCINALLMTHGSVSNWVNTIYRRMEGITVTVDEDLCVECGDCMDVCAFNGMRVAGGTARINEDRCLGCGRCENACPHGAISITIDDSSRVDELIKTLESYVDVGPQGT